MKNHAQIFKALADETRIRILLLLLQYGKLCVCDIEAALAIPQSSVSRHLATLRNTGFVEAERCGMWMHYRLLDDKGIRDTLLNTVNTFCRTHDIAKKDHERLKAFLQTKKENTTFFLSTLQTERKQ